LLHSCPLLKTLWAEAAAHIMWLINWTSTRVVVEKTPFEVLYGKKLDPEGLCKWSAEVWIHDPAGNK
ncbi:hypothetical protein AN958_09638, partial [Leucoagaricus sp. SymC.cos]